MTGTTAPEVQGFFDDETKTVSYAVADPETGACAVIDSVLDYDPAAGRTSTGSADAIIAFIESAGYAVDWIIDTHLHADHLSAAHYLKSRLGGRTAIGDRIPTVQTVFGRIFNEGAAFPTDGRQFDHLFADGETYRVGGIEATAIGTPGHTPACMAHHIGDAVFVGDTLFMPDLGTARCDFPGGSARELYRSIHKILRLPEQTRMFLCHDYKAEGRDAYRWETSVGEQKRANVHVGKGRSEEDFVTIRTARDATLAMPKLILPSVQINMRAGQRPPPEENGTSYLKVPMDVL